MDTKEAADKFTNCVMHRYKSDTVMRGWLTILILLLPTISLISGSTYLSMRDTGDNSDVMQMLVRLFFYLTFFILMIVIFLSYRRLLDHSYRDKDWRSALIMYAESYGLDSTILKKIDNDIRKKEKTIAEYPGLLLIILYFIIMLFVIAFPILYKKFISSDSNSGDTILITIGILLCILMILFVFLYVIRFPNLHEKGQIKFTTEFARLMKLRGMEITEMQKSVKYVHGAIAIILLIVTLGFYSLVMIYRTYKCFNDHIFNQWSYETRLMNTIIRKEGGIDVAAIYTGGDD